MTALATLLAVFTLVEVNYPLLGAQSRLAIFAGLGLVLCFLIHPTHRALREVKWLRLVDGALVLATVVCCGYVVAQNEPWFRAGWSGGQSLGNRAGAETRLDIAIGIVGLLLILEATRRAIGWALPILAGVFLAYAVFGASMPDWLFPHRGYSVERIVSQTFLHSQGVFGIALNVMFTYVFLFVIFGAALQTSGATEFIINFARRVLGGTAGGPAKVAVLSSGLMGSLSGSAVANTATTGTFTIPMMRAAGFRRSVAAGVEAAASSGGALVPPVMGAGAYMMLEIIDPPVTYLQIIRAALIPALLYYFSLLTVVHLTAKKIGARAEEEKVPSNGSLLEYEGVIFFGGFAGLISLLLVGYTVFTSASLALVLVLFLAALHRRTRISLGKGLEALTRAGKDAIPLVSAAACVGIILGVVTLTGVGTRLPSAILSLSQGNLISALFLLMVSSIVLGMGLPSAVCYLLMATLVGPVMGDLGVVPLAIHLFIFYFGMMSMVTPPVALAAYAAASIAGAGILSTSLAAFRFALVGFALPYLFVFRPQLLMLDPGGGPATWGSVLAAVGAAVAGIVPFAVGIAGYLFSPLSWGVRALAFVSAALLLLPPSAFGDGELVGWLARGVGVVAFTLVAAASWGASLRRT